MEWEVAWAVSPTCLCPVAPGLQGTAYRRKGPVPKHPRVPGPHPGAGGVGVAGAYRLAGIGLCEGLGRARGPGSQLQARQVVARWFWPSW